MQAGVDLCDRVEGMQPLRACPQLGERLRAIGAHHKPPARQFKIGGVAVIQSGLGRQRFGDDDGDDAFTLLDTSSHG